MDSLEHREAEYSHHMPLGWVRVTPFSQSLSPLLLLVLLLLLLLLLLLFRRACSVLGCVLCCGVVNGSVGCGDCVCVGSGAPVAAALIC
jgi:hypothetical protein